MSERLAYTSPIEEEVKFGVAMCGGRRKKNFSTWHQAASAGRGFVFRRAGEIKVERKLVLRAACSIPVVGGALS